MAPEPLTLPWGKTSLELSLPEDWQLAGVLEPTPLPVAGDPAAEVRRSLREPIGSPRLGELYHPGMRVAIVIDDGSRPTPVSRMLPAVMEELKQAGLRWGDLTLVPAIGLHRAMTAEELAARIGFPDLDGLAWENPECDNPEALEFLGATSRGTPVWINKTVVQADLVISIGCIEPHLFAGFGGGYKNILPGVAGRATIARNHALNCTPATFNVVGQPFDKSPIRLDLEEGAKMLKGRVFISNAVLNGAQQVVRIVSGDPVAAHREGVRTSAALYGVCIPFCADVVITDSHPMDIDLRQGMKALANSILAVRKGGTLITLVRAEEGVGVFGLANRKLPLGRGALQVLAPLLVWLLPRLKLKGVSEEDRLFLYMALQAMRLSQLIAVAPTLPAEVKKNLVFMRFADTPEAAIQMARAQHPGGAKVLVFPHGAVTYPVLPG